MLWIIAYLVLGLIVFEPLFDVYVMNENKLLGILIFIFSGPWIILALIIGLIFRDKNFKTAVIILENKFDLNKDLASQLYIILKAVFNGKRKVRLFHFTENEELIKILASLGILLKLYKITKQSTIVTLYYNEDNRAETIMHNLV